MCRKKRSAVERSHGFALSGTTIAFSTKRKKIHKNKLSGSRRMCVCVCFIYTSFMNNSIKLFTWIIFQRSSAESEWARNRLSGARENRLTHGQHVTVVTAIRDVLLHINRILDHQRTVFYNIHLYYSRSFSTGNSDTTLNREKQPTRTTICLLLISVN